MKISFTSDEIKQALAEFVEARVNITSGLKFENIELPTINAEIFFGSEITERIDDLPNEEEIDTKTEKVEDIPPFVPDNVVKTEENIFSNASNGTALSVENSNIKAQESPVETPVQTTVETPPQSTETKPDDPQPAVEAPTSISQPISLFAHLADPHRVSE